MGMIRFEQPQLATQRFQVLLQGRIAAQLRIDRQLFWGSSASSK